ncbi:hypothetical protein AB0J83_10115 [Actinoplanes sp. NPDC049596]|uniref:hypothetical protein n=1 Tax=unclassified Actinoplanes TaxID=2626549 RepID=UPI003424BA43
MTNWMTAAGIALIAGGIATLICFRSVLFRVGGRRAGRKAVREATRTAMIEADRHPRRVRGSRRRSQAAEWPGEDEGGGLALIGLADEEERQDLRPYADEEDRQDLRPYADEHRPVDEVEPEEPVAVEATEPFEVEVEEVVAEPQPQPAARYGHRVEGWVRPEYRQTGDELPSGEYWTPIPVELEPDHEPSAKGYGWPVAVERLPPVPDYEPATGFDLTAVPFEPTEVVPTWPPDERSGRIRLPRNWQSRNEKRRAAREQPPAREWRSEPPAAEEPPVERRRPRPRPRPSVTPPTNPSRVYVSRHAADPPQ